MCLLYQSNLIERKNCSSFREISSMCYALYIVYCLEIIFRTDGRVSENFCKIFEVWTVGHTSEDQKQVFRTERTNRFAIFYSPPVSVGTFFGFQDSKYWITESLKSILHKLCTVINWAKLPLLKAFNITETIIRQKCWKFEPESSPSIPIFRVQIIVFPFTFETYFQTIFVQGIFLLIIYAEKKLNRFVYSIRLFICILYPNIRNSRRMI